jgi:hypothetical protein
MIALPEDGGQTEPIAGARRARWIQLESLVSSAAFAHQFIGQASTIADRSANDLLRLPDRRSERAHPQLSV